MILVSFQQLGDVGIGMATEYERFAEIGHAQSHHFWSRIDWIGWIRVFVIILFVVGGQLITFSSERQKTIDAQLSLQQALDRNTAALQTAVTEQKALKEQIVEVSKWLARVDQSKSDLERRVDRMEPYVFKRSQSQ
jgi:hypothetical protein